jgi:selenide,water dikinase
MIAHISLFSTGDGGADVGDDDDAAICALPPSPALALHTVDFFKSSCDDPFLFGQIATTHALSDIYAMNGIPTSALAICMVPLGLDQDVEDTLVQLLAGCLDVLQRENCTLVGGHTTEGADLTFGLSVNGYVHPER